MALGYWSHNTDSIYFGWGEGGETHLSIKFKFLDNGKTETNLSFSHYDWSIASDKEAILVNFVEDLKNVISSIHEEFPQYFKPNTSETHLIDVPNFLFAKGYPNHTGLFPIVSLEDNSIHVTLCEFDPYLEHETILSDQYVVDLRNYLNQYIEAKGLEK